MHILVIIFLSFALLLLFPANCIPQISEPEGNFIAMEQKHVRHGGRIDGKETSIDNGVSGTEVGGAVVHVFLMVVHALFVDRLQDLVAFSEMVVDSIRVDGKISGVPRVGVPDAENDEAEEEHAERAVEGGEGGDHLQQELDLDLFLAGK